MTPEESAIEQAAFEFARTNRAALARKIADIAVFPSEASPFTVFMAGSPGAGKTEVAKAIAETLESSNGYAPPRRVLRIDPDDFRNLRIIWPASPPHGGGAKFKVRT